MTNSWYQEGITFAQDNRFQTVEDISHHVNSSEIPEIASLSPTITTLLNSLLHDTNIESTTTLKSDSFELILWTLATIESDEKDPDSFNALSFVSGLFHTIAFAQR